LEHKLNPHGMPELPEVNTFQQYFDQTALQQRIQRLDVHDDHIIRNLSGEALAQKLKGRTFVDSYRRGKYLFGALNNGHYLQIHFGMSGDLRYYQTLDEAPRHERFRFVFDNGFHLGFDCPRKFARIAYIEDLDQYLKSIQLGEDALVISETDFLKLWDGKSGTLKGFLLNQKYIAGVGNLYADEICYQARLHPASRVDRLSTQQKKKIFQLMQDILQTAVDREAYYKDYPDDWFWKWREAGAPNPNGPGTAEQAKIAGRTTFFFPKWQKLL
jgi:formamidopyrimidine-DNA glycosylase